MAKNSENNAALGSTGTNCISEVDRLSALVASLQAECSQLRKALVKSEEERDLYLKAVYQYEQAKLDFQDIDFEELLKNNAGPVELLE